MYPPNSRYLQSSFVVSPIGERRGSIKPAQPARFVSTHDPSDHSDPEALAAVQAVRGGFCEEASREWCV